MNRGIGVSTRQTSEVFEDFEVCIRYLCGAGSTPTGCGRLGPYLMGEDSWLRLADDGGQCLQEDAQAARRERQPDNA